MNGIAFSGNINRGCNSKELFGKFEIAKDKDFEKYLNQYNTIF